MLRCTTVLLAVLATATATAAPGLELTLDLERFPGPDGILGTADDVAAPDCPELICPDPLRDQYAALGVRFTSGTLFQGEFFPGLPATNHFISSSPPDATLSLPVFGVAIDSYSAWTAVLYALDGRDRVIASDVLTHPSPGSGDFFAGTLRVTSHRPIRRVTVLAEGCEIGGPCDPILNLDNLVLTLVREPGPGALRFSQAVVRTAEGDGEAVLTVERLDGSAGAVSAAVVLEDGSAEAGTDYVRETETLTWEDGDTAPKTVAVPIVDDGDPELPETVVARLAEPGGGVALGELGAATVVVRDDDRPPGAACVDDENTLCLGEGGRFRVRVHYRLADGRRGVATVASLLGRASGLVTFVDSEGAVMLVRVLDGCSADGFFQLTLAATTDAAFAVTVLDTATGRTRRYANRLGHLARPVRDERAFPGCS